LAAEQQQTSSGLRDATGTGFMTASLTTKPHPRTEAPHRQQMSGMGEIVAAAWVDATKRPIKAVVKCMWFLC
jgi:hypothetical protein